MLTDDVCVRVCVCACVSAHTAWRQRRLVIHPPVCPQVVLWVFQGLLVHFSEAGPDACELGEGQPGAHGSVDFVRPEPELHIIHPRQGEVVRRHPAGLNIAFQVLGFDPEDDPGAEILVRIEAPGSESFEFSTNQLSGRAALDVGEYSMSASLSSPSARITASTPQIRFSIVDPEALPSKTPSSFPLDPTSSDGELLRRGACRRDVVLLTHGREGSGTDGHVVLSLVGTFGSSERVLLPKTHHGQESDSSETYREGGFDCWALPAPCDMAGDGRAGEGRQEQAGGQGDAGAGEDEVTHVVVEHRTTNTWRGSFVQGVGVRG